jgi:hypothetical protein
MPAARDDFFPLDDNGRDICRRTHIHHLYFTQDRS